MTTQQPPWRQSAASTPQGVRRGIAQPQPEDGKKKHVYTPPHVVIVNHPGSGANDADLPAIAAALQRQVQEHFAPYYNLTCTVSVAATPGPNDWCIGLFKDADQPGALGYHDMTPHGQPLAKVFPLLDAQDGGNLSTTISHELLEMLADAWLSKAVQDAHGKFWAYEVCDAVEDDEYVIDNIKVSNFVTPQYFEPPQDLNGVKLDYLGNVTKPFEVRPGGYMQWYSSAGGWHQVEHNALAPRHYRKRTDKDSRMKMRARRHHQQPAVKS